jgi:hypothetical protein
MSPLPRVMVFSGIFRLKQTFEVTHFVDMLACAIEAVAKSQHILTPSGTM